MMDSSLVAATHRQAEMLANKVTKRFKHLHKRFAKQNIEAFRLYDWDIPEIRAAVDWYAGHLVMAEYVRRQSTPEWLPMMGAAVAEALSVPPEKLHLKERRVGKPDGSRYERLDYTDRKIIVSEKDLKFYVNLNDFVDTGLFSDHRNTRQMIGELAYGKDFLNLYCYTGSFSCYAAKGDAKSSVSVDRSESAITWAKENMALNGISGESHRFVQSPAFAYLERAKRNNHVFDLAVVDPPSFSTTKNGQNDFDVSRDHPILLRAVTAVMKKGGTIFFSTNHQNFEPFMAGLELSHLTEITKQTIPEDYITKKRTVHRCWKMIV